MIGRLNHVAIAVPDLAAATTLYRDTLGAATGAPCDLAEHGVTVVFADLPNTRIELMTPFGDASPLAAFLGRHPAGGLHHICYEVDDIAAATERLAAAGARTLGPPRVGAHGHRVVFLHPKDANGCLIELEEITP